MEYLLFSLGLTAIHTVVSVTAAVVAGRFTRKFYDRPDGLFTGFLHMADPAQSRGVALRMFPAQIVRGVLMSLVLYPILGALGELDYFLRALFLGGLMFVYADLASNVPFSKHDRGLGLHAPPLRRPPGLRAGPGRGCPVRRDLRPRRRLAAVSVRWPE